ncbi:hypothetical protein ACFL6B_01690 [Thermodesulfobacteriota bacterium]
MKNQHMPWYTLNYRKLKEDGCAIYKTDLVHLAFSMRGYCMVDAFDLDRSMHVAYLDFDFKSDIMLGYAFGSPFIGLPFSNLFRKTFEKSIFPFTDLRSHHDVGFYIAKNYRNKGANGIWNLDEIMMVIAMETAYEHDVDVFTVKPTGDRARYYRKKFSAEAFPTTSSDVILTIVYKAVRNNLKHIKLLGMGNKTDAFKVQGYADDYPLAENPCNP